MQPEVQTTTRGSLAVSVELIERYSSVIQGALEVLCSGFYICRESEHSLSE